jgi:pimeloyl-ACP methyl ester carboxylesterase
MKTQSVIFPSAKGHFLTGKLAMPDGPVRGVALFAHCFTCTMQSRAAINISSELALHGLATMRFDFTGLGGSEGNFGQAGFASDVSDLVAAAEFLGLCIGAPSLLVGHSLGGAAVLAAAHAIPSVRAIATIGAPADVAHALHNIKGDLSTIEAQGHGLVEIGGRPYDIDASFLAASHAADLKSAVAKLRVPILIAHAPQDQVVGIDNARVLFETARHPKTFLSLDDADHLLTRKEDVVYLAAIIASWAQRYLPVFGADTDNTLTLAAA